MTSVIESRGGGWKSVGLRLALWGVLAGLLALPAAAMRMGAEGVVWTASDFAVMGALLALVGLGGELVVRASGNLAWRAGAVAAVLAAFLTIWVNLAVGMIGEGDNSYNLLFLGVIALALAGAAAARLRPRGMAIVMPCAAAAQLAAALGGYPADRRGAIFSSVFALPWLAAAGLFAIAARRV